MGPSYRAASLRRMADGEFDVLVVGGGVVGAGAALDAVSRGLSVALVEARDWAAGTSSRSSKLIHGGLRYLEQLDFKLVREALKERALLLTRLAPHLVRPVPFLFPLKHRVWERFYVGAGVTLYDVLDGKRVLPRHRQLSRRRALAVAPGLRPEALVGAVQYFDARVDDARFTMTLARTAAQYGAAVATGARVTALVRDGERVTGAKVLDLESGEEIVVRARQVINATGVWTEETRRMTGAEGGLTVRASKGVHITVPRDRITLNTGLILRTEKSVLFVIPWGRHWIIGTTDTDWSLSKAHPVATQADIDYLLDHVNEVLSTPIGRDDIEGVYAGLRPLLAGDASDTAKLSREHTVARPAPGLVVVAGGKYTTYRVMAKDAVDVAARELSGGVPASVTDRLPLLGAEGYEALWNRRAHLAARAGLDVARVERLLRRYGSAVEDLLQMIEADSSLGLPLAGAGDYLRAEVVYAASHEGARRLEDVLARRTRIAIEERDRGLAAAPEVAALMAPVLGWDERDVLRETEEYAGLVQAELAAEHQPDDLSADATRAGLATRDTGTAHAEAC
ncbi:glycerol-3-phosphate dehydrogenase/oxidase [Sphaerisporangium fuscum]|uniref:glycerol-3-phosphate dehydrogenase/oxidase n=1 Tax=Sphaerisporangium fuscum TaxID=2835868 RepID=UPI002029B2B8|nr:glycerol-3-phosphate dehydrogenase/oxidase [Sphaerisporangium fuscum]